MQLASSVQFLFVSFNYYTDLLQDLAISVQEKTPLAFSLQHNFFPPNLAPLEKLQPQAWAIFQFSHCLLTSEAVLFFNCHVLFE